MWDSRLGEGFRFTAGILFGVPFLLSLIFNWVIVVRWVITRKRQPSMVPLIGGIAGALAVLVSLPGWRRYAWVPLVADPSCASFLLWGVPALAAEFWNHSRINLVSRYVARPAARRTVTLSLYRKDFVLDQAFKRLPGEAGVIQSGTVGEWQESPEQIVLQVEAKRATFRKECQIIRQTEGDLYEQSPELSLDGLVFEKVT